MDQRRTPRLAAAGMVAAAGAAIAGFSGLGSIFDYPEILKEPTEEILTAYRAHEGAITGWFLVLVIGAALLGPVAVLLGRMAGGRQGRWIAGLGVAAAVVQVVGLARWVVLVPAISDQANDGALDPRHAAAARHRFELLHTWLGEILGETIGYVLSAAFTVLVVSAVGRGLAPRWVNRLGVGAAALISTGVLVPLGVGAAELTNFAGYIAWSAWLVAMAVVLWRSASPRLRDVGVGSDTIRTSAGVDQSGADTGASRCHCGCGSTRTSAPATASAPTTVPRSSPSSKTASPTSRRTGSC